ncbi:MAG TPA: NYN domain-containing protein [Pyrinomonadaceae bacterium]
MDEATEPHDRVKAALFVDFDNIYSGLRKIHPKAAEEFATNPARWLAWFDQGMPSREADGVGSRRRRDLLLRHCYLNPRAYGAYRADFTRSAFRVVDCPPLTQQNKNSTDIHMVMDILDALSHRTHFDEFIILSGDSDFTPVLLRLRLYDRRTVILTPGPAAQAYKAASDHVISEDMFIEEGLGLRPERTRRAPAARQPGAAPAPTPPVAPAGTSDALKEKVIARLNELVAASASPIDMASAAADVIKHVGAEVLTTQWAGAGSFKELLRGAAAKGSRIMIAPYGPGYVYDPARHTLPSSAQPKQPPALPDAQESWEGHPEKLSAFARRVSRLTGAPPLKPEEYALVFKALEDELREESYFLSSTSRAVRDRCNLRGLPVSRSHISYILKGIAYGGHDYEENASANNAEALGQMFREQVLKLCKSAQLDLSGDEQRLLERWIKA